VAARGSAMYVVRWDARAGASVGVGRTTCIAEFDVSAPTYITEFDVSDRWRWWTIS
jgi:hypothetical protein